MSIKHFLLVGAGGHSTVVLDALQSCGQQQDICVVDESVNQIGKTVLGLIVQRLDSTVEMKGRRFHVSIGRNDVRARIYDALKARGGLPSTIFHPVATIARSASIADGTFVAARAVIAPAAAIGEGVIVNHGAIVDHECVVHNQCHIAPGATLAGNVRLGLRVFIGAGANILPGVTIGDDAIIGAGAVVTADVPPGMTYAGVPARKIR
ncbi:NeuD/PglB/VioB family sugar acetyltransferase [Bradyrhizobium ottawaense]|uniref:NeuD/PglB/VioB family sugar acetyltransferase n=1 Tax=Bradyrhizobium ottawaense TaxID=931866 RepID=UPI001BAB24FA|nr:NeuD/PglB/VioB family sugar acetyltransferase [Bradyrhizobium ottawaense]MBR1363462.1 NeuD/PglB/VioB family sugar acetyltransferase [Bradyrhizobium ottawaense]